MTITTLAEKIISHLKSASAISYAAERPGDIKHSCADISKIAQQWQDMDLTSFDTGLAKTIEYYSNQL